MIYNVSRVREQMLQETVVPEGPRSSQEGERLTEMGRERENVSAEPVRC